MEAQTVREVIEALDTILEQSRAEESPLGYFPALYRRVTVEIEKGIADGTFDDGPRMERLDVVFANRYLRAYAHFREGAPTSKSWQLAFESAARWRPIVVQHLLLGINAHINLDLGIAAARVAPGDQLSGLRGDFHRVNAILASLVDEVEDKLSRTWPTLRILDWLGGRSEEEIINFAIGKARDAAWSVAERLAPMSPEEQESEIAALDDRVTLIGRGVRHPGLFLSSKLLLVRLGELGSVPEKIGMLS
jgi:hypothetical protein